MPYVVAKDRGISAYMYNTIFRETTASENRRSLKGKLHETSTTTRHGGGQARARLRYAAPVLTGVGVINQHARKVLTSFSRMGIAGRAWPPP